MIRSLDEFLHGKQHIGITGHVKPDGDCVGSTLGLLNYIREQYPGAVSEVYLEFVPEVFRFMKYADEVKTDYPKAEAFDLFIVLDCGSKSRIGDAAPYFDAAHHTLCIDHHVSNTGFADENHVFPDASSTAELVYELLDPEKVSKNVAECLYTGIVHDTGVFQYSCTKRRTMEIAGILMEKGISYPRIISDTYFRKTYAENRLLGVALKKSRLHLGGAVISAILEEEDYASVGATGKDTEGIVAQLRNTKGTESAILIYKNLGTDTYKLSLRSTECVDCAQITAHYGGGGHVRAAGATITKDPNEVLTEILSLMERYLGYFEGENLGE